MLVGEIRDEETAQIAIQAAMTGHLVLSTLHAQTAAASIARLVDMGVEPSLIATSVNCIVAQRLARRLCTYCREPYRPTGRILPSSRRRSDLRSRDLPCAGLRPVFGHRLLRPRGPVRGAARDGTSCGGLIGPHPPKRSTLLRSKSGMTTLRRDGMRLVLAGISSLEEVRRVSGDWVD